MSRKQKKIITQTTVNEMPVENVAADKRGKKIMIICVCAFLSLVLLFGLTFGTVMAVRNSRYVMVYDNVGVDAGVASYLSTYYKARYISYLKQYLQITHAEDTTSFWNSPSGVSNNTYGDYLVYETERFISELIASNVLFDKNAKLTDADKEAIDVAVEEVLDFRHQGSISAFNKACKQYGFDYNDFVTATEMLYKSWAVSVKMFGAKGENIASNTDFCDEYLLSNYYRTKLIFIRTETEFVLDENGKRVQGDDGNDLTRPLTDAEKAERQQRIETIRAAVAGINSGEVSPERFDELAELYNEGDRETHDGYYFSRYSSYTNEFAEGFPEVVTKALSLNIGDGAEVNCSVGVCFLFRDSTVFGAYKNTADDWCFSDFYALAAADFYANMVTELAAEVEKREKWSNISPIDLPYQTDYVARF